MNHFLGEIKFLMLFVGVLGDHGDPVEAITATVGLTILVILKGANSRELSYAPVALGPSPLVLTIEPQRFEKEHDGNLNDGNQKKDNLNRLLAPEKTLAVWQCSR